MAFINQIGKILSDAGQGMAQQTKNISDLARLTGSISEKKHRISQLYTSLGQAYYARYKDDPSAAMQEMTEIKQLEAEITQCRDEINRIKNIIKCPSCGMEMSAHSVFCSCCGTRIFQEETCTHTPEDTDGETVTETSDCGCAYRDTDGETVAEASDCGCTYRDTDEETVAQAPQECGCTHRDTDGETVTEAPDCGCTHRDADGETVAEAPDCGCAYRDADWDTVAQATQECGCAYMDTDGETVAETSDCGCACQDADRETAAEGCNAPEDEQYTTSICPNCQAPAASGNRFCSQCGARLEQR